MEQHPVQEGVVIFLGMHMLGISSGSLGLCLVRAFTFNLPGNSSKRLQSYLNLADLENHF